MPEHSPHHSPPEDDIYDVTFIGAGPSGLFGSFYSGMERMSCKIIDARHETGGQLSALYPDKPIFDIPGHRRIIAKEYVKELMEQVQQWNPKFCLDEKINSIIRNNDGVIELSGRKEIHKTRTLVISAGKGLFESRRLDNNDPSIDKFEERGVFYNVIKDKKRFHHKRVLVVGGGDSAVDWALDLKDIAKNVTLIHRRGYEEDGFKAKPASVAELRHQALEHPDKIQVMLFHELKKVSGDAQLEKAIVFNNQTIEESSLDVDYVLLLLGFDKGLGSIRKWGIHMRPITDYPGKVKPKESQHLEVSITQATNIPGIFAAGDITWLPRTENLNLIATGASQAAVAVNYAKVFLRPGSRVAPGHSSNLRL